MASRYETRRVIVNNEASNELKLEKRNKKRIRQYATYYRKKIPPSIFRSLEKKGHRWKAGDKFFKLAQVYYGNPELWWVIASFNEKPTENHCRLGDLIYIPLPAEKVLAAMEIY